MKYLIVFAFAFLTLVSACKKDDVDNTAPVIDLVSPVFDQSLAPGSSFSFTCHFTDDGALKSYKIDIHSAEGHTHTKSAQLIEEGHPWTYEQSWDFESGLTEATVSDYQIQIPDSLMGEEGVLEPVLTGEYHLGVFCTDVSGNESHIYTDIVIE